MGHSCTGLEFPISGWKSSKLSIHSLLKNMSQMLYLDLNKKGIIFQILPGIQIPSFLR